ncbi:predicted protein [Nematostella vectensis]|uniref:RBR-type E3 ubiquitin transferase n=1 Tax=Nematostella vectensis TaxID=45351 RepID=A7RN86_NEMVE|nr:uncharacterized protein LOC5519242 [Nematostella vectensis]EDO47093.1 predicted protein [Nematostella vectensis]|eukprot:XP_001639156.1 predicted protein [Nematostella vectensis]
MGWNERGKYGIHHGRTLRYNERLPYFLGSNTPSEFLMKHSGDKRGFSDPKAASFLNEAYGIDDGLDIVCGLVVPNASFERIHPIPLYSLGKRKRWLLPELVKERMMESPNDNEDDSDEEELGVCITERHVHFSHSLDCNCLSVATGKGKRGNVFKPKKTYSTKRDLNRGGVGDRLLCYEVCSATPSQSWPNYIERKFYKRWDMELGRNRDKASCKVRKNKGNRWGGYSEREIRGMAGDSGYCSFKKKTRKQKCKEQKGIMRKKTFDLFTKRMHTPKQDRHATKFDLGSYIESVLNSKNIDNEADGQFLEDETPKRKSFKPYEKGCAIYMETKGKSELVPAQSKPEFYEPELKTSAVINIRTQDLDPSRLQETWSELYTEGGSFPRKFVIDVKPLLSKELQGDRICKVLFETEVGPNKDHNSSSVITSIVTGSLDTLDDVNNNIKTDFVSTLALQKYQEGMELEDVIKIVVASASRLLPSCKAAIRGSKCDSKSLQSLDIFNELHGWKYKVFSVSEANEKLQQDLVKQAKIRSGIDTRDWFMVSKECGICFGDFRENKMTALMSCGHSFCTECWEFYLKSQISRGEGDIGCPGYNCDVTLDNVTIMSLTPSWYPKFLKRKLNRALEMTSSWRWCPGKNCRQVVNGTELSPNSSAWSVLCKCGGIWCFKCGSQAHWPASCVEARKFYRIAGNYEKLLINERKELINSVMVKNCPSCHYPIEKHLGCNFMTCVMCKTNFCWICLIDFKDHDRCLKEQSLKEVELTNEGTTTARFEGFLEIVRRNTFYRLPKNIGGKVKRLKLLAAGVNSYKHIAPIINPPCRNPIEIEKLMEKIIANNVLKVMEEGLQFSYQAHLAVEGAAKKAAVCKNKGASVVHSMSQLEFIADRIDELCIQPIELCEKDKRAWLSRLIQLGKGYMCNMVKVCEK